MNDRTISFIVVLMCLSALGCGGQQERPVALDIRPLEENRAFEIIDEVIAERGYQAERNIKLSISSQVSLTADYRMKDHKIGIEYLTQADRERLGPIPDPAPGSRLHVLLTHTEPNAQGLREAVYVFFIDDRKFVYHFNPTSERRADVTFLEVDSRLRRDIEDFLSWYESNIAKR